MLFIIWAVFIFGIPKGYDRLMEIRARQIPSNYMYESQKSDQLMAFEKKAEEMLGRFKYEEKNTGPEQEVMEQYFSNDFQKIQETEAQRHKEMDALARADHTGSIFIPTLFYISAAVEISGGGYKNILGFSKYTAKVKEEFTRYYIDKKFYSDEKKVDSFVNLGENIFRGRSRLPGSYPAGIVILLVYTALLLACSYYRFRQVFFNPSKEAARALKGTGINLYGNRINTLVARGDHLGAVLYARLGGGSTKSCGIEIGLLRDGDGHRENQYQWSFNGSFLYICHPYRIPGEIRAGELIELAAAMMDIPADTIKSGAKKNGLSLEAIEPEMIGELTGKNLGELLLAIAGAKHHDACLLDHVEPDVTLDLAVRIKRRMAPAVDAGSLTILLSSRELANSDASNLENLTAAEDVSWLYTVGAEERRLRRKNKS